MASPTIVLISGAFGKVTPFSRRRTRCAGSRTTLHTRRRSSTSSTAPFSSWVTRTAVPCSRWPAAPTRSPGSYTAPASRPTRASPSTTSRGAFRRSRWTRSCTPCRCPTALWRYRSTSRGSTMSSAPTFRRPTRRSWRSRSGRSRPRRSTIPPPPLPGGRSRLVGGVQHRRLPGRSGAPPLFL